jgi:hypothetical protein
MADPCQHTLITVVDGEHRCADCGDPVELRTSTGKIITPADIDQFVEEAERGYDVSRLHRRGRKG